MEGFRRAQGEPLFAVAANRGSDGSARREGVGVAIASSNVGFLLLRKAGWVEGTGLGAREQGRREPLAVEVRAPSAGLGHPQGGAGASGGVPGAGRRGRSGGAAAPPSSDGRGLVVARPGSPRGDLPADIAPPIPPLSHAAARHRLARLPDSVANPSAGESSEGRAARRRTSAARQRELDRDRELSEAIRRELQGRADVDGDDHNPILRPAKQSRANPLLD